MLKRYWKAAKKPLWRMFKGISALSLVNASFWFIMGAFGFMISSLMGVGTEAFLTLFTKFGANLLLGFQVLFLITTPFVLLYSGVKLFFQSLFPMTEEEKEKQKNKKPFATKAEKAERENVVDAEVVTDADLEITEISKRKTAIQKTIIGLLAENKDQLSIEEIHTLERINEELLTKTDAYYHSLDSETRQKYETEVLARFDELEEKAQNTVQKVERVREKQLERQLHIIDEATK